MSMTERGRLRRRRAGRPRQRGLPGAGPPRPPGRGARAVRARPLRAAPATTPAGSCGTATTRPAYVRLTQEAYADWARLERGAGTQPGRRRSAASTCSRRSRRSRPVDYTRLARRRSASSYELLDAAEVTRRWPQFRLPDGRLALTRRDAAIVPAARGTRAMQDQATRHGADLREHSPVHGVHDLGEAGARGRDRARARSAAAGSWSAPTPGSTTCWGPRACSVPVEVTLEQVTYFQPEDPRASPRAAAAVDLDGRPVLLRLPAATASRPSRPPRTAAGPIVDPDAVRRSPTRAMQAAPRRVRAPTCCRAVARRCARCAASTP